MLITFFGVRGSIAAPGPKTAKYGGNTSCMYVKLANGEHLIFDAGTGIRELGNTLVQNDDPLLLMVSHGHWDHIQGYPFFGPIYQPDREIFVCQGVEGHALSLHALLKQMDGSNFPVQASDLPSRINTIQAVEDFLKQKSYSTTRKVLNHPGGGYAFRVEEDGVSFAYVTDNELDPPGAPQTTYDEWVEFCRDTDVLIHDAQYEESDMPAKHGWGHSVISQVRQLALDANVKNLVLFHHDPDRTDAQLDEIALASAAWFKSHGRKIGSYVAAEGMSIELSKRSDARVSNIAIIG